MSEEKKPHPEHVPNTLEVFAELTTFYAEHESKITDLENHVPPAEFVPPCKPRAFADLMEGIRIAERMTMTILDRHKAEVVELIRKEHPAGHNIMRLSQASSIARDALVEFLELDSNKAREQEWPMVVKMLALHVLFHTKAQAMLKCVLHDDADESAD